MPIKWNQAEANKVIPPTPIQENKTSSNDLDKPFSMVIEDVFSIDGGGTVVTGTIATGIINLNDSVEIVDTENGNVLQATVTGIELFRKLLDSAETGDNCGLLLRGITPYQVKRGMAVAQPKTISKQMEENKSDEPSLNDGILFFMYYTIPDEFKIDKSSIEADASVIKTLNLDNQSFVKLVNLIKNYFCIDINNDEASSYLTDTFNDMYWFIVEKIEQKRRHYPSVAALVRNIAVWKLGVEEEEVVSQAHWIDDLGCDSLDAVKLTMCFEAMFNIQIPDEVAEHLETVGDVVNYIEQNAR